MRGRASPRPLYSTRAVISHGGAAITTEHFHFAGISQLWERFQWQGIGKHTSAGSNCNPPPIASSIPSLPRTSQVEVQVSHSLHPPQRRQCHPAQIHHRDSFLSRPITGDLRQALVSCPVQACRSRASVLQQMGNNPSGGRVSHSSMTARLQRAI